MRLVLLVMAGVLVAADAPQISDAQRAKFWRAQAEYVAATVQAQRAKAALDAVQMEMSSACGETYQLAAGQDGEPICQPKPPAPAKGDR